MRYIPQHNPALIPLISDLKALRWKQAEIIDAIDALEFNFGGLTEAQENTRDNAVHKFDEASKALCGLGIIARPWHSPEYDEAE
jgi:hypothetical protein